MSKTMPSYALADSPRRPGRGCGVRDRGFTLIELIMVIVILGVLAVYAAPRIFNTGDFYARGFHDGTLAYLRYAQKTAIAQRRTVCVSFNGGANSLTLSIAANASTYSCAVAGALSGPNGVSLNARPGVSYAAAPTNFNFDGLGQPITGTGAAIGQTIQVPGTGKTITVEVSTGYVHE